MSAARNAAEDGPDLSSEDDAVEEKSSQGVASDQSEPDDLPTPRLGEPNGITDDESIGEYEHAQTSSLDHIKPHAGSLQAVKGNITDAERPSSADGSLSIPDDTPSVQVRR